MPVGSNISERSQHKEAMGHKFGLTGRVLDKAYALAWDEQHHAGLDYVEDLFEQIAGIVDEVDLTHLPDQPLASTVQGGEG